MNQVIKKLN